MAHGSIRQLGEPKERRWEVRYELGMDAAGKRRQKSVTVKGSKRDAERLLRETLAKLEDGSYVEPCKMSVAELMDRWLTTRAKIRVGKACFERYVEVTRVHINPTLGQIQLDRLTPLDVQRLYSEKSETLAPSTVRYIAQVLNGALKSAVKWGLLARNPADGAELPRLPKESKVEVLDEHQIAQLLRAAEGSCLHPAIYIASRTAARLGEICALKWDDLNVEAGTLRIDENLEQTDEGLFFKPPKNGTTRVVPISADLVAYLLHHKGKQAEHRLKAGSKWHDHGLIWPKEDGTPRPPDGLSTMFHRWIRKQEGLPPIHFHSLRHSAAVLMLQKLRLPLPAVARILGHRDAKVTLVTYSCHLVEHLDRDAVDELSALLKTGT